MAEQTVENSSAKNDAAMTESAQQSTQVNSETYLKHLLTQASAAADESKLDLKTLREQAIALVSEQSFPSRRDEEWRFTDLSDMLDIPFQRPEKDQPLTVTDSLKQHIAQLGEGYKVATLNEQQVEIGSSASLPDGVVVAPLSMLLKQPAHRQKFEAIAAEHLGKVRGNTEVFTALNTAGFSDVMVVWVKPDLVLDQPICIIRGSEEGAICHLRTLVIAEHHAKFTLVETFCGDDDIRCNTNVSEFWLADSAQVNHIRLQDEGKETFHLAKTAVDQAANSYYQCTAVDLGGRLSRHHLEVYQSGPQTDTHMYGLSALSDRQLADTHSQLVLTYPHGTANQLQKNIVDDRAHSVFNGKVYVSQAAQLTDAAQLNRNLMLSGKARVDTKPELDIVADNVKCAHGATVSQLQADEVFYLQSRGIAADQAQRLLLYGFAMEIVEKISIETLKQTLSDRLTQWAS